MSGAGYSVLVIEDDPDFALLTAMNLTGCGHSVTEATSMHDALELLETMSADLDVVILDLGLPDITGTEGLHAALDASNTPVIVFTADVRQSMRISAEELGASAFLVKGTAGSSDLDDAVRNVVNTAASPSTSRVGFAPFDDLDDAIAAGFSIITATGGPSRWAFIRFVGRDAVVLVRTGLGSELPPGSRLYLDGAVAETRNDRRVHVGCDDNAPAVRELDDTVVKLGHWIAVPLEVDHQEHALLLGWSETERPMTIMAENTLTFVARHLATLQQLSSERARATRRADIAGNAASADALTGLGNRRAYDLHLSSEEARCRRHGSPAVVFVVDLDGLKLINDHEGHPAGDRYIRAGASALLEAVRDSDRVFRTGGDEFAIVAIECTEQSANDLEKRFRHLLHDHGVDASIGWAARPPHPTLEEAATVADGLMYDDKATRAKQRAIRERLPAPYRDSPRTS